MYGNGRWVFVTQTVVSSHSWAGIPAPAPGQQRERADIAPVTDSAVCSERPGGQHHQMSTRWPWSCNVSCERRNCREWGVLKNSILSWTCSNTFMDVTNLFHYKSHVTADTAQDLLPNIACSHAVVRICELKMYRNCGYIWMRRGSIDCLL